MLRGRYLRSRYDVASLAEAVAAYAGAAGAEPAGSAAAQAEIAATYARMARWDGPRAAYFARGNAAAARALALDSTLALAWAARAALAALQPAPGSSAAAAAPVARWARRATALEPGSLEGLRALALFQLRAGDRGAADATFRRILARNVDDVDALLEVAALRVRAGQWDEARRYADRAVAADPRATPAYAIRALTRLQRRDGVRPAYVDAETATQLGRPVWGEAVRARVQAAAGDRDGARATLKRLLLRLDAADAPRSAWDELFVSRAIAEIGDPRVRDARYPGRR
jgi:tetratricopeptide (TPR) repeat protein